MAKIVKRTKKDGSCSYCIRVSNGYDRAGRQVLVNRTYTPPPGMTGKKLERELKRQADAFEQEVRNGISLEASMKMDDLIAVVHRVRRKEAQAQDGLQLSAACAAYLRRAGAAQGLPSQALAPHGLLLEPRGTGCAGR